MRTIKTTTYKNRFDILNTIQYLIGGIIAILFGVGLIPFFYGKVFYFIVVLLVIQIVISFLRLRLLNVILELILLGLALISLIPFLGYLFRFLGLIGGILEMASFKNYKLYKQVEIRTFRQSNNQVKGKKKKPKAKDAEFKEK